MQMKSFSFAVFCLLAISFAESLPSTTTDTDHTESPGVPLEFPKLDQNYTFVDNSSIRENLANHAEIDTEVDDLLKDEDNLKSKPVDEAEDDTEPAPAEQTEDLGRKTEIEWIENGDDTEDTKFENENIESTEPTSTLKVSTKQAQPKIVESSTTVEELISTTKEEVIEEASFEAIEPYKDGVPVMNGSVAAILAGIFLVICIFGYTALIIWRKSLEMKYGSREMLVDKDEMYDPDDIRHFSI